MTTSARLNRVAAHYQQELKTARLHRRLVSLQYEDVEAAGKIAEGLTPAEAWGVLTFDDRLTRRTQGEAAARERSRSALSSVQADCLAAGLDWPAAQKRIREGK